MGAAGSISIILKGGEGGEQKTSAFQEKYWR